MVFLSVTSDCRVQYSRVRLEVKIFDTPAGGIRAHQGTFSSIYLNLIYHILVCLWFYLMSRNFILLCEQAYEITQVSSV